MMTAVSVPICVTAVKAAPETTAIELTRIDHDYGCDVFWPGVPADFKLVASEPHSANGVAYAFERWERPT